MGQIRKEKSTPRPDWNHRPPGDLPGATLGGDEFILLHVLTCDLIVIWFITISGVVKGEPGRAPALPNAYCALPSRLHKIEIL